jgi:hypothetical protein
MNYFKFYNWKVVIASLHVKHLKPLEQIIIKQHDTNKAFLHSWFMFSNYSDCLAKLSFMKKAFDYIKVS